jgi:hypothetical protein
MHRATLRRAGRNRCCVVHTEGEWNMRRRSVHPAWNYKLGSDRGGRSLISEGSPALPTGRGARQEDEPESRAADDHSTPIMLDFVHPIRAGRRPGGEGGKAGFHESCGDFPGRCHIGPIAACFDQPQSSSCRRAENMELLETAKKHKIAALTTLMISRGMFSRDHISAPSQLVDTDHCCRSMSVTV